MVRAHVFITGQVQGVSFRYYTRQEALVLGLTGWVKNLPDGRVEAVFEGDKHKVNAMLAWCRQGTPSAAVTNVNLTWETPQKPTSFEINH